MLLNSTDLAERNNRPTVLSRVGLRAYFINDGVFTDPYDISGVTLFERVENLAPNSILTNNLMSSSVEASSIKFHWSGVVDASTYGATAAEASSIYKVGTGDYVVVLDGIAGEAASGIYSLHGSSLTVKNTASAVGDYIDAWTVKMVAGSTYQTLVNEVSLYDDTFMVLTEPLVFKTWTKLTNTKLRLGSIENLTFTTDITVSNRDIDNSIKNIFKDSSVMKNVQVKIEKVNEDTVTLPATVTISDFTADDSNVRLTSDNTILYKFDTTTLATHPSVADFGGLTGIYRATLKYTVLDETIVTEPYYFSMR